MKKKRVKSAYWKQRFEMLEKAEHNKSVETYNAIVPAFDKAQRNIQGQINAWVARYAENNQITITEARKQLSTLELKEFKWDVKEYIKYGRKNALDQRWMKELENASARVHISRLEALRVRIQQECEIAYGNELDNVDDMMHHVFTDTYYHTCFEIQKGFQLGFRIGELNDSQIQKIIHKPWASDGKTFSERIWSSKTQMTAELQQQLLRQCALGKSPDEAIKAMERFVDNKFKNTRYQAARLVQTEQAFIASAAQTEAFEFLDVEEYEIVATLDSHTSEICQSMDGLHFPLKQKEIGSNAPPFHPNCRTTTVPYFDDEWSGGERAARDEETGKTVYVSSRLKYADWYNKFVKKQ